MDTPEITISPKLILAPFKGLTNKAYRNAMGRHIGGYDEMYAPFISGAGEGIVNPSKLDDVVPVADNLVATVPQIISTSAKEIVSVANALHDRGHTHLNWNLGCPFERIADKFRGCGLLPYPGHIDSILNEAFNSLPIKLSVKMRLGYKSPEELLPVMQVLNNYPLHRIILHPRIGTQKYRGTASTEGFRQCIESTSHHVIYNGDIWSVSKYQALKKEFPETTEWMLGRGALMNPFLAHEIKAADASNDKKRNQLKAFHQELFTSSLAHTTHAGKQLGWMKAIWYYMAGMFADGPLLFSQLKKTQDHMHYLGIVGEAFDKPFADEAEQEAYFRNAIARM